jgi:hypothetical protein
MQYCTVHDLLPSLALIGTVVHELLSSFALIGTVVHDLLSTVGWALIGTWNMRCFLVYCRIDRHCRK